MVVEDEPPSFYTPPDEVGAGGYGVASDVRVDPAVHLSVRIWFPEQISETHGGIYWIVHTHIHHRV